MMTLKSIEILGNFMKRPSDCFDDASTIDGDILDLKTRNMQLEH